MWYNHNKLLTLVALCFFVLFTNIVAFAAKDDEKEVVVLGIGVNEESAKRQAYRNAIQSVIGSMVVSETIVENEELVQDKILSHSDGYVVKATQIGATRTLDGGLIEVTMNVVVKSQQLKQKLEAEKITVTAVDGQSLFAQKKTKDEAKEDAISIITEKLKDLPSSVLVATARIEDSKQVSSGNMVRLSVPIDVTVDEEAYATFYADFVGTMKKLGYKPVPKTLKTDIRKRFYFKEITLYEAVRKNRRQHRNLYVLGVCEKAFRESRTARWQFFTVPKEVFVAIMAMEKSFQLHVELQDKDKNTVTENSSTPTQLEEGKVWKVKHSSHDHYLGRSLKYGISVFGTLRLTDSQDGLGTATIAPEVLYLPKRGGDWGISFTPDSDILTLNMPFDLSEDELQSIQSIKCTVSNIPSPKD